MRKYIILIISILLFSCQKGEGLLIVIPNNFTGIFYIIEDKNNFQKPEVRAFENFGDYVYELHENENKIRIENIKIFKKREMKFSFMWVEPLKDNNINIIWVNDHKIKVIIND